MAYGTTAQLAIYLGIPENQLPADAGRMLDRASELVDYLTKDRATDETDADILARLSKVVCAQVENWIQGGETQDTISKQVESYKVSKLSYTFSDSNQSIGTGILCQRAARELWLTGLLTNRVRPSR